MLTITGGDYEHTLAIEAEGEGALRYRAVKQLQPVWTEIRQGAAFDAAEFSLANLMMMRDRGAEFLRALPIFPNRPFAHIALRVAKDSPISSPAQFRGKRIGVPDYSMTAAVWARGILLEEFGVHWSEIEWVTAPTQRFEPPGAVRLNKTDANLEDLCVAGELDGLLMPHPKEEGRPASERRLRTVIADNEAHERAGFVQTGFHPINHCVILSAAALAADSQAPRRIFDAYVRAKRAALNRHLGSTFMPWGEARWGDMLEVFQGDPFPYGLTASNRRVAQKLADLLTEQELVRSPPKLADVFLDGSDKLVEGEVGEAVVIEELS